MRRFALLLIFSLVFICNFTSKAEDFSFRFGSANLDDAIKLAGEEGKLIFVDFHAKWCTPCTWMDRTTFNDPNVVEALNKDFVSVKVDIDETAGFQLKNTFEIKYLPTMLIFNSQGKLLTRVEETMSPRMLINILDQHNNDVNKVIIQHAVNISPSNQNGNQNDITIEMKNKSEYETYFGDNPTESMYKVQVGVYSKYKTASDKVTFLRQNFLEPINVITEHKDDITYFKVCIGQFTKKEAAEKFKLLLNNEFKIEGIIVQ